MDLLQFQRNVHSQFGEDGILEKVFEVMGITKGTCVEFGAFDGVEMSNTCYLIEEKGWSAVLIEGSKKRFQVLQEHYKSNTRVMPLNCIVGFEPPMTIDDIISVSTFPADYDLLSIDVDGNDIHIFDTVAKYHPKVVVIEFNPSIPNHIFFAQKKDMHLNHGSSLKAITQLANLKGYELICCTEVNGIYVDRKYFPLFEIADNSLDALHKNKSYETYLLQLYDGTLVAAGKINLIWHGIKIDNDRLQMLPREMRRFPDSLT